MLNHQDLMARGLAKLNEIDGEQGDKVRQALADISPDLGKYIIGFAFGEIYQRPQLDVRQRELVTLAALAAQGGCENQLRVHIHVYPMYPVCGFSEGAECGVCSEGGVCGGGVMQAA